jgi:outer membrane protein
MNKLVFLIALLPLAFACTSKKDNATENKTEIKKAEAPKLDANSALVMVFFENDSLITKYKYSKDLEEQIRRRERTIISSREQDMSAFQEMYKSAVERAPYMTTNEKQKAEQDLVKREQELMNKDQQTEQKYIEWKTDLLVNFQKHLDSLLTQFRTEHGYDVLVPSGGGITKFYYSADFDVTDMLINYLNVRYKPEVGKK